MTTVVIDYGSSNLRSVAKALEHVAGHGERIIVSDAHSEILAADRIVFPGQGAIGQCMGSLQQKGLVEILARCIHEKPFLGICMGMQTLMDESEENGGMDALGLISGKVLRFPDGARESNGNICKIPHMGWNRVDITGDHPLWQGIESGERFYFVHSYYVQPERQEDIAATTDYAVRFTSAIARRNLFAVQFHPEKSQRAGLRLLKNFLEW